MGDHTFDATVRVDIRNVEQAKEWDTVEGVVRGDRVGGCYPTKVGNFISSGQSGHQATEFDGQCK